MDSDTPQNSDPAYEAPANIDSTMSDIPYASLVDEPGVRPPPIRTYLAWFVIVGVTLSIFLQVGRTREKLKERTVADKASMMQVNATARYLVGTPELLRRMEQVAPMPESAIAEEAEVGSLGQRYGLVLLENELNGPEAAAELLAKIDAKVKEKGYEPTEEQARLRETVGSLLDQYADGQWDSSTINEEDRTFFVEQLGWVGELGLTPVESPNVQGRQKLMSEAVNTSVAIIVFFGSGMLALLLGLGGLIAGCVLVNQKKLVAYYSSEANRAHLYLETFAIWMAFFAFGIPFLISIAAKVYEFEATTWTNTILSLVAFFGSLIVLIWPRINGVPFSTIRKDIGWTIGNPLKEIGAGIVGYVSMLPVMGLSMILVLLLAFLTAGFSGGGGGSEFAPVGGDGHPIQEDIANGDAASWIGVFLLACVAAPIVEETVFRGVFYRSLRDGASWKWARRGCIVFACLVNGFIFAAIHPQGIIAIPILMTLAIGMSLAREWRGSLIAPMTMHAINNSMVTCLMFAIF